MDLTRFRNRATCLGVAAAATLVLGGPARAGDSYQSTVINVSPNSTIYTLTKHGKIKILPSTAAGSGGIVTQLVLSNVDCPPNNDLNVAGKCGVKGTPQLNHVFALSASTFGADFTDVVGVKYKLEQGKAAFQATGKNKIGGNVFGALVSAIFNQPLGVGFIKLHQAGTVPSDCDSVPLPAKTCKGGTNAGAGCTTNAGCNSNVCTANGCTDGAVYAEAGIVAGSDAGITCTTAADCSKTQICTSGHCANEGCTVDGDCDQNGGGAGGTGQCGSNGQCCDPNIDPTCAAQR
jgi:hypothetical protein